MTVHPTTAAKEHVPQFGTLQAGALQLRPWWVIGKRCGCVVQYMEGYHRMLLAWCNTWLIAAAAAALLSCSNHIELQENLFVHSGA
jgi:hypothetical protein